MSRYSIHEHSYKHGHIRHIHLQDTNHNIREEKRRKKKKKSKSYIATFTGSVASDLPSLHNKHAGLDSAVLANHGFSDNA